MAFDLLHFDGQSLLNQPYEERREKLEALRLESDYWQTPPSVVGNGEAMLKASKEQGLEGVVAKRLGSRYEPGKRTGAWTKVKNVHRQEFVIGGWIPGAGRRSGELGSVIVRYYREGQLISAGGVGRLHQPAAGRAGEVARTAGARREPVQRRQGAEG